MDKIIIKNLYIENCNKTINKEICKGLTYLVGTNGSGKTMLCDYISGLRTPTQGEIIGADSIIYINQTDFFSNKLTVKDYLDFVINLSNTKISYINVKKMLEPFKFHKAYDKIINQKWGTLSGGERKIIYIIGMLIINRDWYVLDEPFANLDADKTELLLKHIVSLLNKGKNIIITSHELSDKISQLCSQQIIMDEF